LAAKGQQQAARHRNVSAKLTDLKDRGGSAASLCWTAHMLKPEDSDLKQGFCEFLKKKAVVVH
jgi:hypothetical protein